MSDGAGHLDRQETAALERLYREHAAWLLGRLRRRFGEHAEDLVQEAYLRLAMAKSEVRYPRALLMTVATNLAINRAKRATRAELGSYAEGCSAAGSQADQLEMLLLKQIILEMPQPLRDVFVLARFAGLTTTQIGARLEIAPKTAEWRMTKALAFCAAQLRR